MAKKATYSWEGNRLTVAVEGTDETVVFDYDSYPDEIRTHAFRLGAKTRPQNQINKSSSPADVLAALRELNASFAEGTWTSRGTGTPRLSTATAVVAHVTGDAPEKVIESLKATGFKGQAALTVAALSTLKNVPFEKALKKWLSLDDSKRRALSKAPSVVQEIARLKAAVASTDDDVLEDF